MKKFLFLFSFLWFTQVPIVEAQSVLFSKVTLNPSSPGQLGIGDTVWVNFNYNNTTSGDVLIYAWPYFKGKPVSISRYNTYSPLAPGKGSGQKRFFVVDEESMINEIRIVVKDEDFNKTLQTESIPVNYRVDYIRLYNISLNPSSPGELSLKDTVWVNFDYRNGTDEEIWVYAKPFYKGSPVPVRGFSTVSALPSGSSASGNKRYFLISRASQVDSVKLYVRNTTTIDGVYLMDDTLLIKTVPADYSFSSVVINNISLSPLPPTELSLSDTIWITFDYKNVSDGPIWIYATPYYNGSPTSVTSFNSYTLLEPGEGTAQKRFVYPGIPTQIDTLLLKADNADYTSTLAFWKIPAAYYVPVITSIDFNDSDSKQEWGPNPCKDKINIEVVMETELQIIDISGNLVKEMRIPAGHHNLDLSSFKPGMYYISLNGATQKLLIQR